MSGLSAIPVASPRANGAASQPPPTEAADSQHRRVWQRACEIGDGRWTNRTADPFLRKLSWFAPLSDGDLDTLSGLVRIVKSVVQRNDLQREGDRVNEVRVILDGFAVRYKALSDGRRQVIAILAPGDICDPVGTTLPRADHNIGTVTFCNVCVIQPSSLLAASEASPAIARALRWAGLIDEAILREWLLNVGQRPSGQRIGHLLCEMLVRLQAVGCATEDSFQFPFTQQDLAETVGLSIVHVNRTLQALRESGLIVTRSRTVTIPDVPRLRRYAYFDPSYLQQSEGGLQKAQAA